MGYLRKIWAGGGKRRRHSLNISLRSRYGVRTKLPTGSKEKICGITVPAVQESRAGSDTIIVDSGKTCLEKDNGKLLNSPMVLDTCDFYPFHYFLLFWAVTELTLIIMKWRPHKIL